MARKLEKALFLETSAGVCIEVLGPSVDIEELQILLSPLMGSGVNRIQTWPLPPTPILEYTPQEDPVHFYSSKDPYGLFSNFARRPITIDGKEWPTSEHFFQAMKYAQVDADYLEKIRAADKPGETFWMGNNRARAIRSDWDTIKDDVMRYVVLVKFTAHRDCLNMLLGTGSRDIVEHTTKDTYWADGGDGSGKNMLGRILMETRNVLQDEVKHITGMPQEGETPMVLSPLKAYRETLRQRLGFLWEK